MTKLSRKGLGKEMFDCSVICVFTRQSAGLVAAIARPEAGRMPDLVVVMVVVVLVVVIVVVIMMVVMVIVMMVLVLVVVMVMVNQMLVALP